MPKYRILEYNYNTKKVFEVQQRFLWGLFWDTIGMYDSLEKAQQAIKTESWKEIVHKYP